MDIQKIESYLGMNSEKTKRADLEALNYAIKSYMLKVPFENINVQNSWPISMDLGDLFQKIVREERGGYCYEMNTFFRAYLLEKGYDARVVSATIHTPKGGRSLPGSHMATIVYLHDATYLADVGFGDLPLQAIPITPEDESRVIKDVNGYFRAVFAEKGESAGRFCVQKWNDAWQTKYESELRTPDLSEFDEAFHYNQYDPKSKFVRDLVISIPTLKGRVTMSADHLTITENGEKEKHDVTKENYRQFLRDYFGIDTQIKRLE